MLIIKGILIGIGKVLPGVSGSMIAISLGLYKKMIDSLTNLFKDFKTNCLFLIKIFAGIVIGISLLSKIIFVLLNKYYMITMFLFIGLIVGSLNEIKIKTLKKYNLITYISFILVLILGTLKLETFINIKVSKIYFLIGLIESFTTVIPGISGTAILTNLGLYNSLLEMFSKINNFSYIIQNIQSIILFLVGLVLGLLLTIKLISYLFKKFEQITFNVILGISFSTVLLMIINCFNSDYTLSSLILGIIFFGVGYFIMKKINHF